MTSFLVW